MLIGLDRLGVLARGARDRHAGVEGCRLHLFGGQYGVIHPGLNGCLRHTVILGLWPDPATKHVTAALLDSPAPGGAIGTGAAKIYPDCVVQLLVARL